MRAVKPLAAEIELADIFVPIVASARARDAKKAAARLSQLSIKRKGSLRLTSKTVLFWISKNAPVVVTVMREAS
jgi:peptidoglycan biosynthesis protein MviN/MurJ (putative lipid II flippase)